MISNLFKIFAYIYVFVSLLGQEIKIIFREVHGGESLSTIPYPISYSKDSSIKS